MLYISFVSPYTNSEPYNFPYMVLTRFVFRMYKQAFQFSDNEHSTYYNYYYVSRSQSSENIYTRTFNSLLFRTTAIWYGSNIKSKWKTVKIKLERQQKQIPNLACYENFFFLFWGDYFIGQASSNPITSTSTVPELQM